jgi:FdhD protein
VVLPAEKRPEFSSAEAPARETVRARIVRVEADHACPDEDALAIEEPLEIRLGFGPVSARRHQTVSITMRTPGCDTELAAGFLYAEGLLDGPEQLQELYSHGPYVGPAHAQNGVTAELQPGGQVDLGRLQRHFYTTSSCGVCGKASLEALAIAGDSRPLSDDLVMDSQTLLRLPDALRSEQAVFGRTGGLHASALFSASGELLGVREDVGRHNALDKLIGSQLVAGKLPLRGRVLLLSGRASFELLQKAFLAEIPLVAAVGAPSSLAVAVAERFGITLVGWLRGQRFSIYTHPERVRVASEGME